MTTLSDRIIALGRDLVSELGEESNVYRAIRDGVVTKEGFIEFLVQHHKYARVTYDMMKTYARTMGESSKKAYRTTIHSGADNHAEEEKGHDDGILADLAILWACSPAEALARIEASETAPSVDLYLASVKTALSRFPSAIAGLAAVLECVGEAMARPARDNLLERRPFPGSERALRWLSDHCEDGDHVGGGRIRIDLLEAGYDQVALQALARVTAVHYREIYRYMDARHPHPVAVRAPELASV
jgi:hypothetical protein